MLISPDLTRFTYLDNMAFVSSRPLDENVPLLINDTVRYKLSSTTERRKSLFNPLEAKGYMKYVIRNVTRTSRTPVDMTTVGPRELSN